MTNDSARAARTREAVALADQLIAAAEELDCWVSAALVEQAKHLLMNRED